MKPPFFKWLLVFFSSLLLFQAPTLQARYVTLMATANTTNSVYIEDYEVAEVVSRVAGSFVGYASLEIIKDGKVFPIDSPGRREQSLAADPFVPLVIAGPATIRLRLWFNDANTKVFCTVKITPEAFPPDKTIMVYPGPIGAEVTMEWSTNLTNWYPATNGLYNNLNETRFFRIRAIQAR